MIPDPPGITVQVGVAVAERVGVEGVVGVLEAVPLGRQVAVPFPGVGVAVAILVVIQIDVVLGGGVAVRLGVDEATAGRAATRVEAVAD